MKLNQLLCILVFLLPLSSYSMNMSGKLKTGFSSFLVSIFDEPGSEYELHLIDTVNQLKEDSCLTDTKIVGDFRKVEGRLGYDVPTQFAFAQTLMVTGCAKKVYKNKTIRRKMKTFVFDKEAITLDGEKVVYQLMIFPDNYKAKLIKVK